MKDWGFGKGFWRNESSRCAWALMKPGRTMEG